MLVSIGDRIRPGNYRFHSAFSRVVNFHHRGRLISVVDERIGPGPLNIVLRRDRSAAVPAAAATISRPRQSALGTLLLLDPLRPQQAPISILRGLRSSAQQAPPSILKGLCNPAQGWIAPLAPSDPTLGKRSRKVPNPERVASRPALGTPPPLRVTARTVLFAGCRFHFTASHRYDSTLHLEAIDLVRFHHNLSTLGDLLRNTSPPKSLAFLLDRKRRHNFRPGFERTFAEKISRGARQVFHGDLLKGVAELKGCGPGLTPSGDDFIAGLLLGLHLVQKLHGRNFQPLADAVFRAARGTNVFSNTFLDSARRGLVFGRMKDLLAALLTGREKTVRAATGKLLAIGASSGADLATGFLVTLRSWSHK